MLHWDRCKTFQQVPAGGGVDIIEKNDGCNFVRIVVAQAPKGGAQFVGVHILTIHNNDNFLPLVNEVINVALDKTPGIGYFAEVGKLVQVPLIEQSHKFFVAVEDISLVLGNPADVHLVRIKRKSIVVNRRSVLCGFFTEAVRHNKQFPNILPIQPKRKKIFTIIDSVGNNSVDFNNVARKLCAGFLYKIDAVCG